MSYAQVKAIREERARLAEQARQILDKAQGESRDLTSEEDAQFEAIHADIERKRREAERLECQLGLESDLATPRGPATVPDNQAPDDSDPSRGGAAPAADVNDVLKRWGMGGVSALTEAERKAFTFGREDVGQFIEIRPTPGDRDAIRKLEKRAMGTPATTGGEFVPEGFWNEIQRALLAFGSVRQAARIIRTASGQKLPIPTVDDTSNVGALLAENTQVTEQDVATGELQLDAFKYTSKLIRVSHELMNDSAFDVGSLIVDVGGERIGRITEQHYTTGTGTGQPRGVVTASTLGKTAAANNVITFSELIDLKHSVDPAYRASRSAGYMFNDTTLAALKKVSLGTGDARPLWQPGVAVGAPDTVDGSRYWINQQMANIGTVAKSVLYGDFGRYWIRDVEGLRVLRLVERYADFDQVAFVLFFRTDADLVTSGAIKHLVHPV